MVRNDSLDARVDPLFNVTHLTVWMDGEPENKLTVQHWQWDWKRFTDFNWPFRLLLRYIALFCFSSFILLYFSRHI